MLTVAGRKLQVAGFDGRPPVGRVTPVRAALTWVRAASSRGRAARAEELRALPSDSPRC